MNPTVAITGVGLVTPAGRGLRENWELIAGSRTALTEEAAAGLPPWARWAGRVGDLEPPGSLPPRLRSQLRFLNRGAVLALSATADALDHASAPQDIPSDRRSLYLATGDLTTADCRALAPAIQSATTNPGRSVDAEALNLATVDSVNPFFLLTTLANNPFSMLTSAYDLAGPGTTLASQSPNGLQALDLAYRSILNGRTDLAVVVGCGSWLDLVPRLEMAGIGMLSGCRHGARSFRPLDRRRDGFIVGEGAAALVLEPTAIARSRDARIFGEIEATSSCHQGSHRLAPAEKITFRCMDQVVAETHLGVSDVAFISVHGSGTQKGDRAELRSVAEFCRKYGGPPPLCALKPYTGHMGAASDLAELIICIEAARRQTVPATPGFSSTDAEFVDARISNHQQPCTTRRFISVAYGFGGQSSAVLARATRAGDHG